MSRHRKNRIVPIDNDFLSRVVQTARHDQSKAEAQANEAASAVLYLQGLLGVLVHRLGGRVEIPADELVGFAHSQPLIAEAAGTAIVLTSNRKVPPDELREVVDELGEDFEPEVRDRARVRYEGVPPGVDPLTQPSIELGLCPGCGHDRPLLPIETGEGLRNLCADCIATLGGR